MDHPSAWGVSGLATLREFPAFVDKLLIDDGVTSATVIRGGRLVAVSAAGVVVRRCCHPPSIYVPAEDVVEVLRTDGPVRDMPGFGPTTFYSIRVGDAYLRSAAWSHRRPMPIALSRLAGLIAFDATLLDVHIG